ncbi:hypothetical protein [Candidatus Marinarcus aquaticus]|uniref:Uncharacterized protein n=1 Tax=Candidatus Marinarcus aquaticus TaxID=2044504 RepID=A0A4Q0XPC7_9BACT|nr:hypothetical protein [Candidatus Marinarcus aquaticus]RXJ53786.1 hypothetical protein CRV04_12585 [Candidatus Marinarcus aquaticus]
MSQVTQLAKIPLSGTKKGVISISNVTEPYGAGTADVVSIGIALNGEDVEWKSHIPYDNIDEVVKVLLEAKANK